MAWKNLLNLERNTSWQGQILGIIVFYICFKIITVFTILILAIILGDGSYLDFGYVIGLLGGFYIYRLILKRFQKPVTKI